MCKLAKYIKSGIVNLKFHYINIHSQFGYLQFGQFCRSLSYGSEFDAYQMIVTLAVVKWFLSLLLALYSCLRYLSYEDWLLSPPNSVVIELGGNVASTKVHNWTLC
jgi:hypothetical protein